MSLRKERSRQMMATPGFGSQINQSTFKIRSQTNPEKFCEVATRETTRYVIAQAMRRERQTASAFTPH